MVGSRGGPNPAQQTCAFEPVIREKLGEPRVVAALRDAEHPAHKLDGKLVAIDFDELVGAPKASAGGFR